MENDLYSVMVNSGGKLQFPSKENFLNSNNIASIDDIKQKANSGVLHFNGGYVIGPKDDFIGTFDTLSLCQTIKINNHDFENDYTFFFSIGVSGVAAKNDAIAFYIDKRSSGETFKAAVLYEKTRHPDLTASTKSYYAENKDILTKILDGKFHTISLIFKVGEKLKLYVDGVLVATSDEEMPYSLVRATLTGYPNYYSYGVGCRPMTTSLGALKSALISRCEVFNFDITAENAPYSINDYLQNKPIPPYLLDPTAEQRAELALENFTFNGDVLDYSGKGRHGKIEGSGSVKGDNDRKVETLFEKFSARISNQTNG